MLLFAIMFFLQMRLDLWQGHQDRFRALEREHRLHSAGQVLMTDKQGQLSNNRLELDVHEVDRVAEHVRDLEPVQHVLGGDQLEVVDAQIHLDGLLAPKVHAVLFIADLLKVGHQARGIDLAWCTGNVTIGVEGKKKRNVVSGRCQDKKKVFRPSVEYSWYLRIIDRGMTALSLEVDVLSLHNRAVDFLDHILLVASLELNRCIKSVLTK